MMNPRHTHSTTSTILFSPNTGPLQPPRRIRPCLAALKPMSSTAPPARPGASFPSSGTPTSKKKSAGPSSWAALAKPAAPFAVAAPPAAVSNVIPDPETAQQRHARALRKHLAADPDASAKRAQELAAIRAAWGGSTTKEAGRLGTNGSMKKRRCVVCTRPIEGASGGTCASCGGDTATGSSSDAEVEGVDNAAETLLSETTELVEIVSTPAFAFAVGFWVGLAVG